jgi:hypothetical protein
VGGLIVGVALAAPWVLAAAIVWARREVAGLVGAVSLAAGLWLLRDASSAVSEAAPVPIGGLSAAGDALERAYGRYGLAVACAALAIRMVLELIRWRARVSASRAPDDPARSG